MLVLYVGMYALAGDLLYQGTVLLMLEWLGAHYQGPVMRHVVVGVWAERHIPCMVKMGVVLHRAATACCAIMSTAGGRSLRGHAAEIAERTVLLLLGQARISRRLCRHAQLVSADAVHRRKGQRGIGTGVVLWRDRVTATAALGIATCGHNMLLLGCLLVSTLRS